MLKERPIDQYWEKRHCDLLAEISRVIDESQPPDVLNGHSNKRLLELQKITNEIRQLLLDNDHKWDVDYDRRRG